MTDDAGSPGFGASSPGTPPRRRGPGARWSSTTRFGALEIVAGAVALVALLPLGYLGVRALERGPRAALEVLLRDRTFDLAVRTLLLAGAVTVACLVLGVGTAWLVTRTDLPGRRALAVLLALPLAIPSYVAAFTWLSTWPGIAGFSGAFIALTAVSYPLVLLPVAASLRTADPALTEVARSLGLSPWQTFLRVTVPQVRSTATAGSLLVALYVLSDFGAVSVMRYDAFTTGIFTSYRASFDRVPAAVLGVALVLVAVVLAVTELRARGTADRHDRSARATGGLVGSVDPVRLGRWKLPALAALALVVGATGVPVAVLVRWLTTRRTELDLPELLDATAATLQLAGLGALATTVLALPVGLLVARRRGPYVRSVELAAYAGHALPGITIGLALVFVGVRLLPGIYQRTPLLVLAYVVLFLPLAVGAIRAAIAASPQALEEVARSLGRGRLAVLLLVTMRLALPGIAAGAALVFLTVTKELPATLLLRPTGMDTLAAEMWSRTSVAAYGAAAPYAAMLVVVAVIPAVVLDRVLRRTGTRVDAAAAGTPS
ncbi:MAG: iron ABC transporter permease [Actinomycetes bacterium]